MVGRGWSSASREGSVGEVGPNEGRDELLLVGAESVRGEVNEMRECDVAAWLHCDGLLCETCGVIAVTRSWTKRSPYTLVSTDTFVRAMWFVADV